MECYLCWPLTESFFFPLISRHSRRACWDTLSQQAVKGKEGNGRLQLAESSPVHMRMRNRPPYCIVLWQKGMRLCWMEKTDCLLKSLTCRSPHSPSSFLTNTHTPNIYTDVQAFLLLKSVLLRIGNRFIYSVIDNIVTPCCHFSFRRVLSSTFVEAVALTKAIFGPKGEELEGKPSTACESSEPLFSPARLWSVKRASAARRRRPRDRPANRRPGAGGS